MANQTHGDREEMLYLRYMKKVVMTCTGMFMLLSEVYRQPETQFYGSKFVTALCFSNSLEQQGQISPRGEVSRSRACEQGRQGQWPPRQGAVTGHPSKVSRAKELRKLSWSGIPKQVRPIAWKLLSGYLPANVDRRESTLQRKRKEYFAFVEQYYDSRNDESHQDTYRQIHIDIPRMSPEVLRLQPKVTEIFERILFIWAIRHPASGYVQGINDLVTPFFVVFVCEYIEEEEVENFDVSSLPEEVLQNIEADSYWCMSKLLDGIQDNYTFAQPGIQKKVKMLEELVSRIDEQVHRHLDQHEVKYLQFAFRWMNNLLMREVPLRCTIRLWDTYQSEPEGFSHFHLYVCAAFLVRWRKEILEEKDFQELLIFLQNLPTIHWGNEEISVLLAEAYRLKFAFADAPNHYKK
uniref:Rab-GAP TBC domain-containing protein n=1 Tax=Apteryx owenii TaxID=8824 RepID=A0A8B9PR19_APTOW